MAAADAAALPPDFAARLLAWYDRHGRHDLPWQHPRTSYRVWIAEVMLQQTQVATVLPYYARFMAAFPDLAALAGADLDAVLAHWSGLGYYSRARNLHAAARRCMVEHAGELPRDVDALSSLPGIGRSTAAAILAQAHDQQLAILDGNVRRVLARMLAIDDWPGAPAVERRLWQVAEAALPQARLADYTQAIMDFGATLCRRARPDCAACPLREDCRAFAEARVAELPKPRPRRALPRRRCVLLALVDADGRLLLQRRPPSGIWGGLWCLPQFDDDDDARAFAAHQACDIRAISAPAPSIDHAFTHFQLRIDSLRLRAGEPRGAIADADDLRWTSRAELATLGLPAPVRRLLSQLIEETTP